MFRFSLALIPLVSLLVLPLGAGLALTRPLIGVVSEESHDLMAVDLDGDGREDILTINDEKGTIDILYGLSEEEVEESDDPEGLPFAEEEVITGRNADALAVGDFDGDGLADIAVGSERGGAAVFFQTEPRTFETARRLRAPGRFVVATDWLGTGRPQVLAIATSDRPPTLSCLTADEDRELRLQWAAPLTAAPGESPRTLDWNGDGHIDLVWATVERDEVHVLLNDGQGGVGGEILVDIGQALDWAPLPLEEGVALLTLESASGIARLLVPSRPRASDSVGAFGGARHLALPESDSADRLVPAVIHALNGADALFLPSHEGSEALLVTVDEQRGLHRVEVPSFHEVEMSQSLSGGRVLLLSQSEGMVGFAHPLAEGSQPPQPLPVSMEPLAAAVGQFNDQTAPDLIVIGRNGARELVAEISPLSPDETEWNGASVELPGLPDDDPTALRAADLDGNGLDDLTVFFSYRPPVILLATDSGFIPLSERFQASSTFFEGVGANQFHVGDLDSDGQPEVLIARGGLIRVLSFS
ncbi:VCBS repeat-containing protein, partial [Candidatus Sumerlaeota bacterium]|nr:VCBS repeat-containing protein [Candidatus Sumerlaeota bacterium]